MQIYQWERVEKEQLNPHLQRQAVHGGSITLARLNLKKGCVVPRHQHVHEQITTVEAGSLCFHFDHADQIVNAGETLVIPPNEAHQVDALEDSIVVDIFAPVREDWKSGDDAYLRR